MSITRAIILSAGQGSRLLPLTADRPKCLIEFDGRAIIDHQIAALAVAGIEQVTVVGGYRIDRLEAHFAGRPRKAGRSALQPLLGGGEQHRQRLGGARSAFGAVRPAQRRYGRIEPALLADCLARFAAGTNLVVEKVVAPEDDDMRVVIEGGRVAEVGKCLPVSRARHRSLGVIGSPDADGNGYRAMLEETLRGENGALRFHHAVVDRIARQGVVHAIEVSPMHWQEIDRPEDIASWKRTHRRDDCPIEAAHGS